MTIAGLKAKDMMTRHVVTIDEDMTVAEAVQVMRSEGVTSLIVNRRDEDDAYGIMTRRDVVNKVIAEGRDLREVKVSEIMTKPLITTSKGLSLENCARLMRMTNIRRLPIFDGQKVIGLVSNTDIFDAIEV
jgi:CBS domain-containing protein